MDAKKTVIPETPYEVTVTMTDTEVKALMSEMAAMPITASKFPLHAHLFNVLINSK